MNRRFVTATLTIIGFCCAGILCGVEAQPQLSRSALDAVPIYVAHLYVEPADGFIALAVLMWTCWLAAACIRLQGRARRHRSRIGGIALVATGVVTGLIATGMTFLFVLERYEIHPLDPGSKAGCRIVIRTQPWMSAAHGDYLIQRRGQLQLRSSGVEWGMDRGGPSLPYDEYWKVQWSGEHAVITEATRSKPVSHIDC